jgi:hypothetical protein
MAHIALNELDLDPALDPDPGSSWHPRPDKTAARDADGDLVDLDDTAVAEHRAKPEAADQPDAGTPLEAESSSASADGQV